MLFDAWPEEHPGFAYNKITGTTRSQQAKNIAFLLPDYPYNYPAAATYPDLDRLPQFANRGEIIAISPRLWSKWLTQPPDLLAIDSFWDKVVDPNQYGLYGAQRLDENSPVEAQAPVDMLMNNVQRLILHEVSDISYIWHY